jgi:hypothetical protein
VAPKDNVNQYQVLRQKLYGDICHLE